MWMYSARASTAQMWSSYRWPALPFAGQILAAGGTRTAEAAGKDTCMLIDNVGLYRLFGLPTAYRDWKAMFEGRLAGKGYRTTRKPEYMAAKQEKNQNGHAPMGRLKMVMSHELLWDYLNKVSLSRTIIAHPRKK